MQNVEVTYAGLIRTVVRGQSERLEVPRGATLGRLLEEVIRRHGPATRRFLFDESVGLLPQAIVLVNGAQVRDPAAALGNGDTTVRILVMSPMMVGG